MYSDYNVLPNTEWCSLMCSVADEVWLLGCPDCAEAFHTGSWDDQLERQ